MKVPDEKLRSMLGIAFKQNEQRLAVIDTPLKG
jgi:hypothetical protein